MNHFAITTWRHSCGYCFEPYNLSTSDNMTVLKEVVTLPWWTHRQSFTMLAPRLFFCLKGLVCKPRHTSIFVLCSLSLQLLIILNHQWSSGQPILINNLIQLKYHLVFVCQWFRTHCILKIWFAILYLSVGLFDFFLFSDLSSIFTTVYMLNE